MMKKTLMIVLLCLPMALLAQERGSELSKPGEQNNGRLAGEPERTLTAQINIKVINGREACQIDLGSTPEITFKNDKFVMSKLKELTTSRYQHSVDALNALTQLGFEVESSYALLLGSTQEIHIILTKEGFAGRAPREGMEGTEVAPSRDNKPSGNTGRKKRN